MRRIDKLNLLTEVLAGNAGILQQLKRNSKRINQLVIYNGKADQLDPEKPMHVMYHLGDGTRVVEWATRAELIAKGAVVFIPHNRRRPIPEFETRAEEQRFRRSPKTA